MLEAPTALQREVLGAMPYSPNTALLHTDTSLLPAAEGARSSWNFQRPVDETGAVTVTYDLTRLQRLPTDTHYLVTLGGEHLVDPATVIDRMEYEHPLYTPESVAAQGRLPEIDTDRVAFAGAYHGWGFHEDGARSGPGRGHPARAAVGAPRAGRPGPAGPLRDDHPAHASYADHAQLRAPLDVLARRPRRPARPRPAGPLRGARPPRRPRRERCAATSSRSSPTTASRSAPVPTAVRPAAS